MTPAGLAMLDQWAKARGSGRSEMAREMLRFATMHMTDPTKASK